MTSILIALLFNNGLSRPAIRQDLPGDLGLLCGWHQNPPQSLVVDRTWTERGGKNKFIKTDLRPGPRRRGKDIKTAFKRGPGGKYLDWPAERAEKTQKIFINTAFSQRYLRLFGGFFPVAAPPRRGWAVFIGVRDFSGAQQS